jgi:2-polyprenyl-3-methyl-5-hydroxy-6-metoxy-1,4-benzoquinol methylase
MDTKDRAFASYVTTHLEPRKGKLTLERLRFQARRWNASLRRFLPAGKDARIIDLGCGGGSIVWWLHQLGYTRAEGIDLSSEQVAVAEALGIPNVRQADVHTYLGSERESFDVILARDVFEHFDRASLLTLLDTIQGSLKPGGCLIFQVPNAESPFGGRIRYGDITHEQAFTSASVSQLAHMVGFSDVQVYPVEPIIYGPKSFVRYLAWKCVQSLYRTLLTIELGGGSRIVSQNLIAIARR